MRKAVRDGADVISRGRQFHTWGPATENVRLPTVKRLFVRWSLTLCDRQCPGFHFALRRGGGRELFHSRHIHVISDCVQSRARLILLFDISVVADARLCLIEAAVWHRFTTPSTPVRLSLGATTHDVDEYDRRPLALAARRTPDRADLFAVSEQYIHVAGGLVGSSA